MRRVLTVFAIFLIVFPSFAWNWVKVDVPDVFDDLDETGYYYTYKNIKEGTYQGRDTSGSFQFVFGIVDETGEIHFRIMEDGQEKDLTTTKGGTDHVDSTTTYRISFKADDGSKYTYDGGILRTSTTYNDNRISFYHDFRNFLLSHSKVTVVVSSDYGRYELGQLDFSGLTSVIPKISYQVGDTGPAGGIIFYDVDADNNTGNADNLTSALCGWQYLEAASEDLGLYPFGYYRPNGTNIEIGTDTAIGTGASNTAAIVKALGNVAYVKARGDKKSSEYAAKLCADYSITYDGVTYDDWYLPSKDELNLMYRNLQERGLGDFEKSAYWSSSEYNGSNSWLQYFYSGYQYCYVGANKHYVRPIRTV